MRKTLLLFILLGTSIIVGCSSYNDIDFDVESQSLYSPGALKHVEFFSSDKGLEFDYHFDPGDDAGRKPLLIRNLRPHKIYRIRNSGGDRGPFTIYLETDSSGRGVRVLEYPDLPHVAMVEQSLSAILKGKLDLAVSMHIDEEKEQGRYLYPDSVVCASVWFDFRGEIDSLYVLSGPIALYEDEFANPEVHFLGFIENNNLLIGIASLGEENPQTISSFVDTTALQINKEQYKSVSDAFMSHLRNLDVCSFLISSSFINSSGLLVPAHTWLR